MTEAVGKVDADAGKAATASSVSEEKSFPIVKATAVSAIETGHKTAVTDMHWLPHHFEVMFMVMVTMMIMIMTMTTMMIMTMTMIMMVTQTRILMELLISSMQ